MQDLRLRSACAESSSHYRNYSLQNLKALDAPIMISIDLCKIKMLNALCRAVKVNSSYPTRESIPNF